MTYPTVGMPYCAIAGTTAISWAYLSPPPVNDFAKVPYSVDYSLDQSLLHFSLAFPMVFLPALLGECGGELLVLVLFTEFSRMFACHIAQ